VERSDPSIIETGSSAQTTLTRWRRPLRTLLTIRTDRLFESLASVVMPDAREDVDVVDLALALGHMDTIHQLAALVGTNQWAGAQG